MCTRVEGNDRVKMEVAWATERGMGFGEFVFEERGYGVAELNYKPGTGKKPYIRSS